MKNGNFQLDFLRHIFEPRLCFYFSLQPMTLCKIAHLMTPNMILPSIEGFVTFLNRKDSFPPSIGGFLIGFDVKTQ